MSHPNDRFSFKVLLLWLILVSLYYEADGAKRCFKCGPYTNDASYDCSRQYEELCEPGDENKFFDALRIIFYEASSERRTGNLGLLENKGHNGNGRQHQIYRHGSRTSQPTGPPKIICAIFMNTVSKKVIKNCVEMPYSRYKNETQFPDDGYDCPDLGFYTSGPVPTGLKLCFCKKDLCNEKVEVEDKVVIENETGIITKDKEVGVEKCYKCGHGTEDISDECEDNLKGKCDEDDHLSFHNEARSIIRKATEVDFRRILTEDGSKNVSLLQSWEHRLDNIFGDDRFQTVVGRQASKDPNQIKDDRPFVCARLTNSAIKKYIRNCVRLPRIYINLKAMPDGINCTPIPPAEDGSKVPDIVKLCYCKQDLCNVLDSQGRLRGSFLGIVLAYLLRYIKYVFEFKFAQ